MSTKNPLFEIHDAAAALQFGNLGLPGKGLQKPEAPVRTPVFGSFGMTEPISLGEANKQPLKINSKPGITTETLTSVPEYIDEGPTVLLGLRRAIIEVRLKLAKDSLFKQEHGQKAAVRREGARAAVAGKHPAKGLEPQSFRERWRAKRFSRITANNVQKNVRKRFQVYGASTEMGDPFYSDFRPVYESRPVIKEGRVQFNYDAEGKVVGMRHESRVKPIKPPHTNDLGTDKQINRLESGRYTPSRARAEMKAAERYHGFEADIERNTRRLNNEIAGNVGSKREKVNKLSRRLQKVGRLEDQRDAHRLSLRMAKRVEAVYKNPRHLRKPERVIHTENYVESGRHHRIKGALWGISVNRERRAAETARQKALNLELTSAPDDKEAKKEIARLWLAFKVRPPAGTKAAV